MATTLGMHLCEVWNSRLISRVTIQILSHVLVIKTWLGPGTDQLTKAELDVTGPNWSLTTTATWQAGEIMWAKANKTDHLEMDRKRFEVTQYSLLLAVKK